MYESAGEHITDSNSEAWELWRQDDHGNQFKIDDFKTQEEADEVRDQFERRAHKQTYWVKPREFNTEND